MSKDGFTHDATYEPVTLRISMTRGEHRIANELRKAFGGFKHVIIDVDGEKHVFDADSLVRLLEDYESYGQVPELVKRDNERERESYSRYDALFGTPERAARTIAGITCDDGGCDGCTLYGANCSYDSDVLLEWLESEVRDD